MKHAPKATSYAALAFIADERKRTIDTMKSERDELVAALRYIVQLDEMNEPVRGRFAAIARAALAKLSN